MDIIVNLFNGVAFGLERTVNKPVWADVGDGFELCFATGVQINFLCLRVTLGRLDSADDFLDSLEQ